MSSGHDPSGETNSSRTWPRGLARVELSLSDSVESTRSVIPRSVKWSTRSFIMRSAGEMTTVVRSRGGGLIAERLPPVGMTTRSRAGRGPPGSLAPAAVGCVETPVPGDEAAISASESAGAGSASNAERTPAPRRSVQQSFRDARLQKVGLSTRSFPPRRSPACGTFAASRSASSVAVVSTRRTIPSFDQRGR